MRAQLKLATPGASEAPCAICDDLTIYRVEVGDGVAPICSEACLRAWPRVLKMTNVLRAIVDATPQPVQLMLSTSKLNALESATHAARSLLAEMNQEGTK